MVIKKRLIFPLLTLTAGILACQAVPLRLPGLTRPTASPKAAEVTATPSPRPLPSITPSPSLAPATPTLPAPTPMLPVEFQDQQNSETVAADQYTLKLRYPQLDPNQPSAAGFNQVVKEEMDSRLAQFRKDAAELAGHQANSNGSFFGLDYKVFYNQNGLVSLQFSLSTYMQGAAHPNLISYPLNYDLQSGRRVELKDLFQPGSSYLDLISSLCVADLQKRDIPMTLSGAAPTSENYRSWNLSPKTLRITFDAYQVAAYAAGPQTVEIPWKALEPVLDARLSALFLPH